MRAVLRGHAIVFPLVEGKNMRIFLNRSAFSLVEAMVAGVIFTITAAGVFASLAAVQKPAVTNDKSLGAAYCGQKFFESLRANVDVRDWATGKLKPGGGSVTCDQNGVTYTVNYTIVDMLPSSTARQARITISWP